MARYEITVSASAECALRIVGAKPEDSKQHGRTLFISATFAGEKLNETGYLADERALRAALAETVGQLDHQYLNDLPQFQEQNPTAENIARWLAEQLAGLAARADISLAAVGVRLHRDAEVVYRPQG